MVPETAGYAPYAQLIKMLVPSSGLIAIHDKEGELIWCSDGFERPDLRELVEQVNADPAGARSQSGKIRETSNGLSVFASPLQGAEDEPLGCILIELGKQRPDRSSQAVAPSLLRPVIECLEARMMLEQGKTVETERPKDLDLLLLDDGQDVHETSALRQLVSHCVDSLDCVSGALLVPERNLSVSVTRHEPDQDATSRMLDRTQKHLLAWLQLNDRTMVVNHVSDKAGASPYKIISCPVRDPNQRVAGLLTLFRGADAPDFELRDVRILEFMSRKAINILHSQHDSLTGLENYVVFKRHVRGRIESGVEDLRFSLLYVDIDGMQLINEVFGFHSGDEVIQRVAELIRNRVRDTDLSTRVGGDRFAIFLDGVTAEAAKDFAADLSAAIAHLSFVSGERALPVSASIGLISPQEAQSSIDVEHLMAAAELACKTGKQSGPSSVELYADSGATALRRQDELLASVSIQQALQANEFALEAQPIVGVSRQAGTVQGFEILVRMRDAQGTLMAPDKFLAAAQRCGLMPALDRWVVCQTLRMLKDAAPRLDNLPLGVAVNISAQSLTSAGFTDFLREQLESSGLSAKTLCLEIKESAALNNLEDAARFIETCRQIGCRVGLDEFGRGLSSLAHLKNLAVSQIKIDGSLIRRVPNDRYAESLIAGLSVAARTLGIVTVASHVETEQLAEKLAGLDIDYGQGFYYAYPGSLARAIDDSLKATA